MAIGQTTLRDVSGDGGSLESYVQSLPEGKGNLDPSDPKHANLLNVLINGIASGSLSQASVQKLMQRNPNAAPVFAQAYDQSQRNPDKIQRQILSNYFQPEQQAVPEQTGYVNLPGGQTMAQTLPARDYQPQKTDYLGAITAANSYGQTDLADKLAKQRKEYNDFRAPTSQELGIRTIGQPTGNQSVDTLTPDQARQALSASQEVSADVGMGKFSNDAIDQAAQRYLTDGTLPTNLGRGTQGGAVTGAILTRAAQIAKQSGIDNGDLRTVQLANKASAGALNQLSRQEAMVGAFEKNFNKNADMALDASSKVDRTGTPIINQWLMAGKKNVAGNPDIAVLDTAIKSTVNEYTKIISGSMGNTAMAESEIKRVNDLLNSAQTPQQVKAVVNFMKKETANRMQSFKDQKSELRNSMKTIGSKNQSSEKPKLRYNTATGKFE